MSASASEREPSAAEIGTGAPWRAVREGAPAQVECVVLVVTYDSARHVTRLLDSLPLAAGGIGTRCIVVDNGSSDQTVPLVRGREDVLLIQAPGNLGYAGAINLGRRRAGPCEALMILNPDLELEPGAIGELLGELRRTGAGVVVPSLVNPDGSPYPNLRREPRVLRALGDGVCGRRWARRPAWLSETVRGEPAYVRPHDVAWAGGAALLVSAACDAAVGDWDERFFLYAEETDFFARARRRGYRVRYVPTARARHENGGSGRSPDLAALMAVNRIRYFEKYHRRPVSSLFRSAVILGLALRIHTAEGRASLRAASRRSRWSRLPRADAVPSRPPGDSV